MDSTCCCFLWHFFPEVSISLALIAVRLQEVNAIKKFFEGTVKFLTLFSPLNLIQTECFIPVEKQLFPQKNILFVHYLQGHFLEIHIPWSITGYKWIQLDIVRKKIIIFLLDFKTFLDLKSNFKAVRPMTITNIFVFLILKK